MQSDIRGLKLSTASQAAAGALDATLRAFLEYRLSAGDRLGEVLAADPEFAFAHCVRGYFLNMFFTTALAPKAEAALEKAETLAAAGVTPREQAHIAALRAWNEGDLTKTIGIWDDILVDHPTDLLALRLQHQMTFWMGQPYPLRSALGRVKGAWDDGVPDHGFVLGMYAFAREECGDYAAGESIGRQAVEINPDDLWGVHAVAHVLEMQGRHREGMA